MKQGRRKTPIKKDRAGERPTRVAEDYGHYEATSPLRPDVGTQARFRKKRPARTHRYDSSFSPALDWNGRNPARPRS